MRISLVVWGLTTQPRGTERFASMLADSMKQRGHKVEMLVFDPDEGLPLFELNRDVEIHYMHHLSSESGRRETLKHLQEWESDIIVALFSWFGMLYVPIMLAGSGIPLLISERTAPEIMHHRWNRDERLAAMSGADRIHMLMAEFKKTLPDYMQERVWVIGNPVPPASSYAQPGKEHAGKKTILVASSLTDETKQISLLVDAFALLHKSFPEWQVKIFGEGVDESKIKGRIARLGLQDFFILGGFVKDIAREYQEANLFCLPSKYEGSPNSLLEAQAHGLPVVGFSGCTGVRNLIMDGVNGFLAPEMTPESLAIALSRLMSDEKKRDKFGTEALQNTNKYAPEKIFDRWEMLIKDCAACKGKTELQQIPEKGERKKWRNELTRLSQRNPVAMPNDVSRGPGPRISIIVPVYNVEKYLRQCLDSIMKQSLHDIEIICVNDASPDQSQAILDEYSEKDKRFVLLIHRVNKGLAAARNTGLDAAKGDYAYFIDSDDLLASDTALEKLYLRALNDEADETIGGILKWHEETDLRYPDWHKNYLDAEVHGLSLKDLPQLSANVIAVNKLLKRSFLEKHNIRFNESIRKHEDNPFSIQVHVLAKRISITPQTTYLYRQQQGGSIMTTENKSDALYRCMYCHDIFAFIEGDAGRHKFREMYYPMYSRQIIGSAEILSRFSPTEKEKLELMHKWKDIVDLLPSNFPGINPWEREVFEYIKLGDMNEAWSKAICVTRQNRGSAAVLNEELERLERINSDLSAQIEAVYNSRSWRITAPFRSIIRAFRGD